MNKVTSRADISFSLNKEIGQEGKNSKTYLAHDLQLDAEVVVKKIPKSKFDSVDAYFNESKLLNLSSHSNVVPVRYACQDADHVYIAMPYLKNGSLNNLLNSRYLSLREIVVYSCQISSALHNIHSKSLIHFDIKPDNVLLSDRGEALLSDFGLAKHTDLHGKAEQDRPYTKMLPPEGLNGADRYTVTFDIYQLGLTMYRMCNGNGHYYEQLAQYGADPKSFNRDAFRFDLRNGRFPNRETFLEHIPQALRKVVRKCLEINPGERFQSALEVSNALASIDGNLLDWTYTVSNKVRHWKKHVEDGREYTLIVDENDSSHATKKTSGGNKQRVREYCCEKITPKKIREFLGGY